ncbi:MBL fold metallo-hydrolase [soil metagenome]
MSMRLVIVGCTGSFPGPDSPASCYLVEAPYEGRTFRMLIDLGNGALGALQRHAELRDIDAVALSHLHPDHCLDMCGFYVARKYHPQGKMPLIPAFGPQGTADYLATAYGLPLDPGMTEEFDFRFWGDGVTTQVGPFSVTSTLVDHPVEAYALRISAGGKSLVYSGDTGPHEALVDIVRGADVFLAEASFVVSGNNPPQMHLTGAEAGHYAAAGGVGQLLLTHIPPWTDRGEVEADAKSTFDGPTHLVTAGQVFDI